MVIITVVGSIHIDFYIKLPKLLQQDETVIGYEFIMMSGGKGTNQAICAPKLRAKIYMVGRISKDIFGERAPRSLISADVNVDYVTIDEKTNTGITFILLDTSGENMIAVAPGTDYKVSEKDVDKAINIVTQSNSLLLQLEIQINTVVYVAKTTYRYGVRVLLNPAPAMALPRELYSYIDVLVPNRIEAEMLISVRINSIEDAVKAGRQLIERGVENVVITMGSKGTLIVSIVSKNFHYHVPAFRVNVIDTTGAGDVCFCSCSIVALKISRLSRLGAQSAPTLDEVEGFVKQYQ